MKAVMVHGALALVGLLAAYQTWARDPAAEQPVGEVVVVECEPDSVGLVSLETTRHTVTIERRVWDGDAVYWGGVSREQEEEAESQQPDGFLTNAAWRSHLERLAPLRALRGLGHVDEAKLDELGLKKPEESLTLRCGERTHTLQLGGRTYGRGHRYAKLADGREVYVLAADLLGPLASAEHRFKQRRLHDFALDEVEAAEVQAQSATRKLLHRNHRNPREAMWVGADAPDRRNELFDNWFARVARLSASRYLPPDAQPGSERDEAGAAVPVLSIRYLLDDAREGRLEMVRVDAGEAPSYYARTETTRGWVSLPVHSAKQVAREAGLVVGLEEIEQDGEASSRARAQGGTAAEAMETAPAPGHARGR